MTNPFAAPAEYHLTQPGRRTSYNVHDQHNRKWLVSMEMTRGGPSPVGQIIACFDDPLATPQKYLHMVPGRLDVLSVDFDTWASDAERAVREWSDQRDIVGRDLYEDAYNPDTPLDGLPGRGKELVRIIGKPPKGPETILAARDGDKQYLKGDQPERKRAKAPEAAAAVPIHRPSAPKHDL